MDAVAEKYMPVTGKIHLFDDDGPGYHATACGLYIHIPEYSVVGDTAITCGNCGRTLKFRQDKERDTMEHFGELTDEEKVELEEVMAILREWLDGLEEEAQDGKE